MRLAPLTVIFGVNSSGKSSLGHLLLALQQTALSSDRKRALNLGDEYSAVDLGTLRDCIHMHDLKFEIGFSIGWKLPKKLEVRNLNSNKSDQLFTSDRMRIDVSLGANSNEQPEVRKIDYKLEKSDVPSLNVRIKRDDKNGFILESPQYSFIKTSGRKWPMEEPEKFYRVSDTSRARYQNAGFLADFALSVESMLRGVYYLGPLRSSPKRIYPWSGDTPESVGQMGEYTIAAILSSENKNRKINFSPKCRADKFDVLIARLLAEIGVINSFKVKPLAEGRKEYEVLVKTHAHSSEVKLTDVGFGVSQVLPAVVQPFYCPPDSTVWMEQPEIHLHPQVQAELADVFIAAVKARENGKPRNVQLIVESHSEHFLNRLQRRVAEGKISSEDVAVYFCRRDNTAAEIEPLKLNTDGDIENWPANFFGDEMADISARVLAASEQKKA